MHRRKLLTLAGPVYVELLAAVVAGIIDVAWVARLGADSVASVAVATNVENVLMGVILIAELGLTVVTAGRRGAGDTAGMHAAIRGGWLLYALITPVVAVGGWLARDHIAGAFTEGAARELAAAFLAVSLPGLAVYYAQLVVNGIYKGLGDTRTPMRLAMLGNLVLLVLDPLLIYGLLGLPRMGVAGAALATVLGRGVALAVGLLLLRRKTGRVVRTPGAWMEARRVAVTGTPLAAEFLTRMAGALAVVAVVAGFGTVAVAAYGIGMKAMYVATMAFYAIRQAATIHTSHSIGAGLDDTKAIARQTLAVGLAAGGIAAVLAATTGPLVMRAFTSDAAVIASGTVFLRWIAPYLLLLACLIASTGVYLGAKRGGRLLAVTLFGTVLQVPLAYGLSAAIGLPGVWLALTVGVAVQLALLMWGRPAPRVGRPRTVKRSPILMTGRTRRR